jgi:hypothetical protein
MCAQDSLSILHSWQSNIFLLTPPNHFYLSLYVAHFHISFCTFRYVLKLHHTVLIQHPSMCCFKKTTHTVMIIGSYGNSIFVFLKNLYSAFHDGCTILHSHWQCIRVLVSLHPHQCFCCYCPGLWPFSLEWDEIFMWIWFASVLQTEIKNSSCILEFPV